MGNYILLSFGFAFCPTQSTSYFCWIIGCQSVGFHSYYLSFWSVTHGARHIKMTLESFPSLTETNPNTKTLVFPQTKH
jgi:hypothetical protein